MGPDFLITLPDQNLPPLAAMFERYREREEVRESVFSKGTGYLLYKIVDTCVDASFPMLRRMGDKLDQLEDDIFEGRSAKIVQDISNAKQEIINFRRVVRPMRAVLRDLERTKQRYLADDLDIYFDDITDAAERIWDVLENYKEVAEALEDSNESVLSHRLNDSLRVLTAFSVILLPLTLHREHLRDERQGARRGPARGVLGSHAADGGAARRARDVLPPPRLAVAPDRGAARPRVGRRVPSRSPPDPGHAFPVLPAAACATDSGAARTGPFVLEAVLGRPDLRPTGLRGSIWRQQRPPDGRGDDRPVRDPGAMIRRSRDGRDDACLAGSAYAVGSDRSAGPM